jgi:hypothetical protein
MIADQIVAVDQQLGHAVLAHVMHRDRWAAVRLGSATSLKFPRRLAASHQTRRSAFTGRRRTDGAGGFFGIELISKRTSTLDESF